MTDRTSGGDAIVVGGGLVGAAVALGLARAGLGVTLLDEGDVAYRASRGNFGLAWIQGKGAGFPAYARLSRTAAALWPAFAGDLGEQTGIDVAYRQPGGFELCLGQEELEARAKLILGLHNQQPDDRCPALMLSREEVRARLPEVGPAVTGASFCPADGQLDPLRLLHALHRAGQAQGVSYHPNVKVERVEQGGRIFAVHTGGEVLRTERIVLAAGLDNSRLAPMVGLAAPVRPVQGQVLVTQRLPPFLEHPTLRVRQNTEGTVMLGDSHEEVGFDLGTRSRVMAEIARRAVSTFPRLAEAQLVRAWAALRVMPPDGSPIYQESAAMPGAFVTCCHSGVTLAPVHALRVAPAIAQGRLSEDFSAFGAERFDVPAAS
jgi:glycine/D-amino acid oxidase-like deaminating enzyme